MKSDRVSGTPNQIPQTDEIMPDLNHTSLFQVLFQWRIEKGGGRRVGSGRKKGEVRSPALSFSLPDPARPGSRLSPAPFFDRPH